MVADLRLTFLESSDRPYDARLLIPESQDFDLSPGKSPNRKLEIHMDGKRVNQARASCF